MLNKIDLIINKKKFRENQKILKNKKNIININIKKGNKFSIYFLNNSQDTIVASFLPVKDFRNTKTLAWFVSYTKSNLIKVNLSDAKVRKINFFIGFLILAFLIYKQITAQQTIKQKHKLLNDVLNTTDSIMFITNFKTISFSNKPFKSFFNVKSREEFNKRINGNFINIFKQANGCLNKIILKEGETFFQLVQRTKKEERLVSILDKLLNLKIFNIDIKKQIMMMIKII